MALSVFLDAWGTLALVCLVLKLIWLILPPAQAGVQCPTDRWILKNILVLWFRFLSWFFLYCPDLVEVDEVMIAL
jgi:hypothetical protein